MTALVQYDTRDPAPHAEMRAENRQYCESRGYGYAMLIREQQTAPPWWDKLAAVATVLEEEQHDVVLFLDTDAVVMDRSLDLTTFIPDGKVFAAGAIENGDMNAGVFAVRGDDDGRRFIDEWMSHYDKSKWRAESDGWKPVGEWAGESFEQHALNTRMDRDLIHAYGPEVILHCDHFKTQEGYCLRDIQDFVYGMSVSKIVHFCGGYCNLSEIRHDARTKRIILCRQ